MTTPIKSVIVMDGAARLHATNALIDRTRPVRGDVDDWLTETAQRWIDEYEATVEHLFGVWPDATPEDVVELVEVNAAQTDRFRAACRDQHPSTTRSHL